ncbi:MAG: hypothetical protein ACREJB_00635, partial [Planctomycetaceae bacterium]
ERDITSTQAFVEFDRSLHFERFDSDRDVQSIITATAHVVPEDMPARPLELCSFDVVAIAAEGLPGLDGKQMTALVQWVDAGGSLLVMPGAGLEPSHVRFLNELIKAGPDQPPFALGKGGGLDDASPGETPVLVRKSLGRVAVVRADETPIDYDSDAWRRLVWFLWKYRQEHLAAILLDGEWADQAPNTVQAGQPWRPRAASGAWLLDRLLPESVAVVPLTTIAIILGLYVVVVGPVDYFVLGWLRLRKLTWIVFPIVTLAFAGYLVWLSNESLRSQDAARAAVFLDVGDEGQIVRANRIKLHFLNSPQTVETDLENELLSPLDHRDFGASLDHLRDEAAAAGVALQDQTPQDMRSSGLEYDARQDRLVGPPTFTGRVPGRFTATQHIPQWTPQLNRRFQIRPEGYDVQFSWDRFEGRRLTESVRSQSVAAAEETWGEAVKVYFTSPNGAYVGNEYAIDLDRLSNYGFDGQPDWNLRSYAVDEDGNVNPLKAKELSFLAFLASTCRRRDVGRFDSLVSQISPTGGRDFEDLTLLDPSRPNDWVMIVAVPRENDVWIYRKLYTVDEER